MIGATDPAAAASLSAKAKEEGCTGRPSLVSGTGLYRCATQSGVHYFNVPGGGVDGGASGRSVASPSGFPKVDAATQKGRDDVRRKVLSEELATEQRMLEEARTAYASGSPAPMPDERNAPQRYAARVERLRQAVALHEKNIEALEKELAVKR